MMLRPAVMGLTATLVVGIVAIAPGTSAGDCPLHGASTVESARPGAPSPPVPAPTTQRTTKTDASPANTSPKASPSRETAAAPPLDLAGLEKRLRNTKAIGVFTKLALKNQVDDLVEQTRAFHEGRGDASLNDVHERYNLLLLKLLSLLQRDDPPLARDLAASRDAIWAILADPIKFSNVAGGR